MRRWVLVLALVACKEKGEQAQPPPPSPVAAVAIDAAPAIVPAIAPASPIDAAVDARIDAAPAADPLGPYAELLVVDVALYDLLNRYPGVPASTRFQTDSFKWEQSPIAGYIPEVVEAARHATVESSADDAVRAYLDVLAQLLGPVSDLNRYYAEQQFIDDEFDRGRRDAKLVEQLRVNLAKLRPQLWSSVLAARHDASGTVADSPRMIVTTAWEACMRAIASVLVNKRAKQVDPMLSACRRSIPTVKTLAGDLDHSMRELAAELGDYVADGAEWRIRFVASRAWTVTHAYVAAWPQLATTPAEKSP